MGAPILTSPASPDPQAKAAGAQECWVAHRRGQELARISLWWQGTPPLAGERVGAIGALAPGADPHGGAAWPAAAATLLRRGCRRLAEQGCTRVLAPMDGNTWNGYRLRLDPRVGFPGEPEPGPGWLAPLAASGFGEQARYLSSRCHDLGQRRLSARVQGRLAGLHLHDGRGLDPLALLPSLHALVHRGFQSQPYFLPLPLEVFAGRLADQLGADPARLALLAFDGPELVGLLLGRMAGPELVVRTLVVRPGRPQAGLGALLLEEAHHRAGERGCTRALHVLMQAAGPSARLSRHYAQPLCRYVLMGRRLAPGPRS